MRKFSELIVALNLTLQPNDESIEQKKMERTPSMCRSGEEERAVSSNSAHTFESISRNLHEIIESDLL